MNNKSENLVIDLTCYSGPKIWKSIIVNDVWVVIKKYWTDLYKEQGKEYMDSECFEAREQAIKISRACVLHCNKTSRDERQPPLIDQSSES